MHQEIIKRTLRVPIDKPPTGNSTHIVTSLDSLLISNGFKLSPQLFAALSSLEPDDCTMLSRLVLDAAKELIGAHVKHNAYFKKFPDEVPDTMDFWCECVVDALSNPDSADVIRFQLSLGFVNLLDLPKYGKYLHSYEDMVAVHEAFTGNAGKNIRVLQLGGSCKEEMERLYLSLAESPVPLSEYDRELLSKLSVLLIDGKQPQTIPMRENRGLINAARIKAGAPIIVDTVTDVLRLASQLSGGDVTLAEKTRFISFPRSYRRILLSALDEIAVNTPGKLADINTYREQWKRLFERLHPWEYKQYRGAAAVHEAAMGINRVQSITSKIEAYLGAGDINGAIDIYKSTPGMLYRNIDRLLRLGNDTGDLVVDAITSTAQRVPARILFGIREHLQNRQHTSASKRIFSNTKGKAWVADESRELLPDDVIDRILGIIDAELTSRLPELPTVVIDPDILGVALPKSNKGVENGYGIMPRGSRLPVCTNGGKLRFFMYWKQREDTTDYDLSTLFLDKDFINSGHASYTDLRGVGYKHSGDITQAPKGASEFIEIDLSSVNADYIIPQVNVYSGEGFNEVEESFFGFMERRPEDKGLPYEPATVRNKSDIRGIGRVALPLVFQKQGSGWVAYWMRMYLKGSPRFNRVEENKVNTTLLARAIVEREYIYMSYVVNLLRAKCAEVKYTSGNIATDNPIIYIGLTVPENLPKGSKVYTLSNLHEIVKLFDKITQ